MERLPISFGRIARTIGPWLPEPVDTSADPFLGAERGEALELAVLMLMEKLTPQERAAYVLREAFDYPYPQIADILQSTEPAVRQLVSRARKHVTGERKIPVPETAQRRLLATFLEAARSGDLQALEKLFAGKPVRRADNRTGPALDMVNEPGADLLEIGGKVQFGDRLAVTCVRPQRLIRV